VLPERALPCDSVSLSGEVAVASAVRSFTAACTWPVAWRAGSAPLTEGAAPARRWRNDAKSALWAWITLRASAVLTSCALLLSGRFSTTPERSRFMLLSMNACGLPRYSDTSIWSSDTPLRAFAEAIEDSVSPLRTR
jgi:hypothetical protein